MSTPPPGRASRITAGLILVLLHLAAAGTAWNLLEERRAADAATRPALAEVLVVGPVGQFWGGAIHRAVLGFRTETGRWIEVTAAPGDRRVGDRQPIRYDPAWPARLHPDGWANRWGAMAWLGAAWAALLLASAWMLRRLRPRGTAAAPRRPGWLACPRPAGNTPPA